MLFVGELVVHVAQKRDTLKTLLVKGNMRNTVLLRDFLSETHVIMKAGV